MAGVVGKSGGKNLKRPEAKLGRPNNAKSAMPGFERIDASDEAPARIYDPDPAWAVPALQVWDAYVTGPQRVFAESVDYAYLWIVCATIDACHKTGYKGAQIMVIQSMMSDLGMTEIQRRQAKILIDRTPPPIELAPVMQIDAAKKLGLE